MIIGLVFIIGLIFGSFINAFVWRIHKNKNWVSDRSICPQCKHVLQAKYLIPVASWLWLRGKCAYCKKSISWQYPVVELLTGLIFAVSYLLWPASFDIYQIILFILWLKIIVLLISLMVYDIKWMLLPDKLVVPLTVLSLLFVLLLNVNPVDLAGILFALFGGAILFGIFYALFQLSKGAWIGGGDVKIAFALGLLAGTPINVILLLFMASVIGTITALPTLISKKNALKMKIPFGPFLIVATVIVFFWGNNIINWYTTQILLL